MQDARYAAGQYATYLLSGEISPLLFGREAQKKFASNVAELGQTGIKATLDDLNARKSQWEAAFKLIAERRCAQQRFAQPRETAAEALAAVWEGFANVIYDLKMQLYAKTPPNAPALFLKL